MPLSSAGFRINGLHLAPGTGRVQDAIDDDGRRFLPTVGIEIRIPGETEFTDVRFVDLLQRTKSLLRTGTPMGKPVFTARVSSIAGSDWASSATSVTSG